MSITAQSIIDGVKRRVTFPSSQVLLNDTDILAFANEIIQSEMIPILESLNQDYFVTTTETPIIPNINEYSIPYRAIGRSLREIKIRNGNNFYRNLALISIENAYLYQNYVQNVGFHFKGDKIRMVPDVPSSLPIDQFLVIWYRMPPSKLVPDYLVSQIISITYPSTHGILYTDIQVTNPSVLTDYLYIDFVQAVSGSSIYEIDVPIAFKLDNVVTIALEYIPLDLVAGDYICPPQTSTVVNFLPNETYPLIVSLTAKRCLKSIGDFEGTKELEDDIQEEKKNIKMILQPRIEGEPTIIINPNSISRMGKQSQRSWLYGQ